MSDQRVYENVIIASLWENEKGNFRSMTVDAKVSDAVKAAFEVGGQFLIRRRTKAAIEGSKNPKTTPTAYLEFAPKKSVDEFNAKKIPTGSL